MFLLLSGSSITAVSASRNGIVRAIQKIAASYESQYEKSVKHSDYHRKNWPTPESFVGYYFRNIHVVEVEDETVMVDYNSINALRANCIDEQFWTFETVQEKTGEHITAKVVKKGLKSFGKEVVIDTKLKRSSNTVAPTPAEWKEMYDQMVRIVCTLPSWGKITVSPDTLDEYKMTPKYKETTSVKFLN